MEEWKFCYQCTHFGGCIDEEALAEDTDGTCIFEGIYTDAYDDACENFIPLYQKIKDSK